MRLRKTGPLGIVLLALFSGLWIHGLLTQLHSGEAAMRYLVLSLAIVALWLWRMPPRAALRRRFRDRRRGPSDPDRQQD